MRDLETTAPLSEGSGNTNNGLLILKALKTCSLMNHAPEPLSPDSLPYFGESLSRYPGRRGMGLLHPEPEFHDCKACRNQPTHPTALQAEGAWMFFI